jgi:hypothetical protein
MVGRVRPVRGRDGARLLRRFRPLECPRRANFTAGAAGRPKSGKVRSVPLIDQAARALDRLSRREHFTAPSMEATGALQVSVRDLQAGSTAR